MNDNVDKTAKCVQQVGNTKCNQVECLQKDKMRKALHKAVKASKEQLIREIFHEVKTPLQILSKIHIVVSKTVPIPSISCMKTESTDNESLDCDSTPSNDTNGKENNVKPSCSFKTATNSFSSNPMKAEIDAEDVERMDAAVFSLCGTLTDVAIVSNSLEINQKKEYTPTSFMAFVKSITRRKMISRLRSGQNINCHISIDATFPNFMTQDMNCKDPTNTLAMAEFTIEGNNFFERAMSHLIKNAIQHSANDADIYIVVTLTHLDQGMAPSSQLSNQLDIMSESSPYHQQQQSCSDLPKYAISIVVTNLAANTSDDSFTKVGFEKIKRYMRLTPPSQSNSFNYSTGIPIPQEIVAPDYEDEVNGCGVNYLDAYLS